MRESSTPTDGKIDQDFDFDSHEWGCCYKHRLTKGSGSSELGQLLGPVHAIRDFINIVRLLPVVVLVQSVLQHLRPQVNGDGDLKSKVTVLRPTSH